MEPATHWTSAPRTSATLGPHSDFSLLCGMPVPSLDDRNGTNVELPTSLPYSGGTRPSKSPTRSVVPLRSSAATLGATPGCGRACRCRRPTAPHFAATRRPLARPERLWPAPRAPPHRHAALAYSKQPQMASAKRLLFLSAGSNMSNITVKATAAGCCCPLEKLIPAAMLPLRTALRRPFQARPCGGPGRAASSASLHRLRFSRDSDLRLWRHHRGAFPAGRVGAARAAAAASTSKACHVASARVLQINLPLVVGR